jgi:hypothetical protein
MYLTKTHTCDAANSECEEKRRYFLTEISPSYLWITSFSFRELSRNMRSENVSERRKTIHGSEI